MNAQLKIAASLFLALSPLEAAAQQDQGEDHLLNGPPAEELIAQLPSQMLGNAMKRDPESSIVTYFAPDVAKDTNIGIHAFLGADPATPELLRDQARQAFHESVIRKVLREGSFTSPRFPGASTFFGEYLTGRGYRQTWHVVDRGRRINVTAIRFSDGSNRQIEEEIGTKIFGGAVLTAAAPKDRK